MSMSGRISVAITAQTIRTTASYADATQQTLVTGGQFTPQRSDSGARVGVTVLATRDQPQKTVSPPRHARAMPVYRERNRHGGWRAEAT
jgi:hypothetical protein